MEQRSVQGFPKESREGRTSLKQPPANPPHTNAQPYHLYDWRRQRGPRGLKATASHLETKVLSAVDNNSICMSTDPRCFLQGGFLPLSMWAATKFSQKWKVLDSSCETILDCGHWGSNSSSWCFNTGSREPLFWWSLGRLELRFM